MLPDSQGSGRGRRFALYAGVSLLILLLGPALLGGLGSWLGARFSELVFSREQDPSTDAMRAYIAELMLENAMLREEVMKAERYRVLLGMTRTSPRTAIAGRVLYRSEGLVQGSLVVDRGASDGVSEGSVCLTADGLVGVVSSVSESTCEVLPLTSPGVRVSCTTFPSAAVGILETDRGGALRLVNIDMASSIEIGEEVVTSRFGGVYPDGLLVGRVAAVLRGSPSLAIELLVEPAVDFGSISEVLLLLVEEQGG
jgi:rod shape-determining protein MreC